MNKIMMNKIQLKDNIITLINQEIHDLNIEIEHFLYIKNNKRWIEAFNKRQLLVRLLIKINEM